MNNFLSPFSKVKDFFLALKSIVSKEKNASTKQKIKASVNTKPIQTVPDKTDNASTPKTPPKKPQKRLLEFFIAILFLTAILSGYFYFGLTHLGKFQTADEDLWYADPVSGRIHEYWKAMENKDWERTRINDKPGVTTALLGYWGYKADTHPEKKMLDDGNIVDRYDPKVYEQTTYLFQLPFVIANGVLLFILFWLAWAYTRSSTFALLFTGFTALSPVLIGVSQIVNPDATVWSLGITALFAYLVFVRTTHFRWLLLAGPLFGLALLSKYGTSFLIFFTFFITFAHLFYQITTFEDRKKYANATIKLLLGWVVFIALGIGVFALLMPAAILHPEFILKGTIAFKHAKDVSDVLWAMGIVYGLFLFDGIFLRGRALFFLLTKIRLLRQPILILFALLFSGIALFTLFNWGWHNHFHFEDVSYDAGKGKDFTKLDFHWKPFLEIKPLVFSLQPTVLIPAFLTLLLLIWKRNRFTFLIFTLTTFIVFYYAAILSQDVLVHIRYSVLVYPAMAGLAAIGVIFVTESLLKSKWWSYGFMTILLATSAYVTYSYLPYLFLYTNDLLPKKQIITSAWGYGGYEAAQWLNAQPNAKTMTVWSDYEGVCPFMYGYCIKGSVIKWYNRGRFSGFDYLVVTRKGLINNKSTWNKLIADEKFYPEPVWQLLIGDRPGDFVKIYKMREEYSSDALYK